MSSIKRPTDLMQDALQRELGGARPGVSNTMPVGASTPPAQGPWQKGQKMGAARPGADFNRLGGGFGSADTDSMKHTFGRIAQNFDTTDAGLQALVQDEEFKRLFPSATLDKDWINFGGQLDPHTGTRVGKIDAQRGWRAGGRGEAWQWLPEEEAIAGAASAPGAPQSRMHAPVMPGQSDLMTQILESLQAQQEIDPQALLLEQLR